MFSGLEGNQAAERGSIGYGAFVGLFLIKWPFVVRIEARFAGQRDDSKGGCDDADADS